MPNSQKSRAPKTSKRERRSCKPMFPRQTEVQKVLMGGGMLKTFKPVGR